jgi:hypothetical protein
MRSALIALVGATMFFVSVVEMGTLGEGRRTPPQIEASGTGQRDLEFPRHSPPEITHFEEVEPTVHVDLIDIFGAPGGRVNPTHTELDASGPGEPDPPVIPPARISPSPPSPKPEPSPSQSPSPTPTPTPSPSPSSPP